MFECNIFYRQLLFTSHFFPVKVASKKDNLKTYKDILKRKKKVGEQNLACNISIPISEQLFSFQKEDETEIHASEHPSLKKQNQAD